MNWMQNTKFFNKALDNQFVEIREHGADCDICATIRAYPKQLTALKVHVLSRSFQYSRRCGE